MLEEVNTRKKERLAEIKEKFNLKASEINIDAKALAELIKNHQIKVRTF